MARPDRRAVGWWLGLLGLAACGTVVVAMLQTEGGLSTAANVAQLVSIPLAITPIAVALWLWRRRTRQPSAMTTARVSDIKDVLANAVRKQWEAEAALRSRHGVPMRIHWSVTTRSGVQAHLDTIATQSLLLLDTKSDDLGTFVNDFRRLKAQRLVLLGGPGTGKTTLALQFLLKLHAMRQPDDPVPVLVSAASWDTEKYPDLRTWLTARLAFDYPALRSADLGRDAAAALEGHILPILDGLDELPTAAQAAMINALNRSLGTDPLVLTCRTAEFVTAVENARQLLMAALVMEPEPMSGDAIAEYLERCRPPQAHPAWDDVLRSVRTQESPLTEAAADALGLWLVTEIYLQPQTGPDGRPIPFPDPAGLIERSRFPRKQDLIGHLLDQYVPTIIASRPPSPGGNEPMRPRKRHDPAKVEQWLGFIAHLMSRPIESGSDSRDFAWWRLAKDTETLTSPRILLLPALAIGLLFGFPMAELGWLLGGPIGAGATWLGTGLLFAAPIHLFSWRRIERWPHETPALANLRLRGRSPSTSRIVLGLLPSAVAASLLFGAVGGMLAWISPGLLGLSIAEAATQFTLGLGLPVSAFALITLGFVERVGEPSQADTASTPTESWLGDRRLQLTCATAGALVFAAIAAALVRATTLAEAETATFGPSVVLVGVWASVIVGRHHAWMAYVMAIRRLARAGLLPRDLMYFLDDCHRLGLLRAIGPLYQFRHAALQDRLAAKYRTRQ